MGTTEFERQRLSESRMPELGTYGSKGARGDDSSKLPKKKTIAGLFALLLILIQAAIATADSTYVKKEIADTEYSISIPDDWLYGDKNVTDSSPIVKKLGKTARSFVDDLNSSDFLFIAMDKYMVDTLMLSVKETEGEDFSKYSDYDLEILGKEYARSITGEKKGRYILDSVGIYEANARFVKISFSDVFDHYEYWYYFTVKNSKFFLFVLRSLPPRLFSTDEILETSVKSFMFGQANHTKWDSANCSAGKSNYVNRGFVQYVVEEPFVSVFIPDDYKTYWRNMPQYEKETKDNDESDNLYSQLRKEYSTAVLLAVDEANGKSFVITVEDTNSADFSYLNSRSCERLIKAVYYPQSIAEGDRKNKVYIKNLLDLYYIVHTFENSGNIGLYNIRAFTVYDHKMVTVLFQSNNPVDEYDKEYFSLVLRSLTLDPTMYDSYYLEKDNIVDIEKETTKLYEMENIWFYIPDSLISFDRNTAEDDLLLCAEGLTEEDIQSYLIKNDIDCVAYPYDNEFILSFRVYTNNSEPNYTSDNRLYLMASLKTNASQYENEGYIIKLADTIESHYLNGAEEDGKLIWLKTCMAKDNNDYIVYYTVLNGIQYVVNGSSSLLGDEAIALLDSIIQSSEAWP